MIVNVIINVIIIQVTKKQLAVKDQAFEWRLTMNKTTGALNISALGEEDSDNVSLLVLNHQDLSGQKRYSSRFTVNESIFLSLYSTVISNSASPLVTELAVGFSSCSEDHFSAGKFPGEDQPRKKQL